MALSDALWEGYDALSEYLDDPHWREDYPADVITEADAIRARLDTLRGRLDDPGDDTEAAQREYMRSGQWRRDLFGVRTPLTEAQHADIERAVRNLEESDQQ